MALAVSTRAAVFDVVKARVEAATGATYDERMSVGQIPNGRASYFCIGARKTRVQGPEREQAGEATRVLTTYPIEYAHRVMPKQRETRRAAVDAVVDAMHNEATINTAGIETRWTGEDESESGSGEWIIIKGTVEARYLFTVGA